jgi:hypothetical protein
MADVYLVVRRNVGANFGRDQRFAIAGPGPWEVGFIRDHTDLLLQPRPASHLPEHTALCVLLLRVKSDPFAVSSPDGMPLLTFIGR